MQGLAVCGTGSSTILPAVEQRIGSSSQPLKGEPVTGAGFDPAFIPGLTSPVKEEPEDAKPETDDEAETAEAAEAAETAEADAEAPEQDAAAEDEDEDEDDVGAEKADDAGEADEPAPDGPVFEAADRRARIVADHKGVRLALDDQECEFRWDEIGAVETETARFGKRFTVTVHTPDRRWYPIEIEAKARSDFKRWDEELDAVLDAYFEDAE
ncbi:hypothetical protein [Streptomyces griseosporeus]|uniref:hypothetical protein n=1 Tax=Streptomyces griseosporeus TaxID=1910 RepID=UPI00167DDF92|nr:hypothetical protein GCM10018783_37580 [Streptomyces griseosporeus]